MIHKLSDVQSKNIGDGTSIWQYCVVLPGAKIGSNCNICSHCFIENDVIIGNNVTIKCGVQIWNGIIIEDNVFIGPNVTFCNDKYPKSRSKNWKLEPIVVKNGASIGANSTIFPGITIGENSIVGGWESSQKTFLQTPSSIQRLKQLLGKKYNIYSYIISGLYFNIKSLHRNIATITSKCNRVLNRLKTLLILWSFNFISIFNLNLNKTLKIELYFFYKLKQLMEV